MNFLTILYYLLFFIALGLYSVPTSPEAIGNERNISSSQTGLSEVSVNSKVSFFLSKLSVQQISEIRTRKVRNISDETRRLLKSDNLKLVISEKKWLSLLYLKENLELTIDQKGLILSQEQLNFFKHVELVDSWKVIKNAPETVRKNTDVLESVSKLSSKKLPNGNVLDVQRLFDNGLTKTLNGASDADKLNIMSKLDSWEVSKVDDLARRLGDSKYSGLADELSDPDFFKLYDDIIHDPENAIDLAKQGGDALLDKVGRSTFFREATDLGRKFESKILNDLLDNSSAAYKKLNELVPDLADRKVLSQVQFCVPGKTAPCNSKGDYFIADAVFVKYDSRGRIIDMVVIDSKLSLVTNLTSGQALAKNGVGGKLAVRSGKRTRDASDELLPNGGIGQNTEITIKEFYKVYGDGKGVFKGIE